MVTQVPEAVRTAATTQVPEVTPVWPEQVDARAPQPALVAADVFAGLTLIGLLVIASSTFNRMYSGMLVLWLLVGAAVASIVVSVALRRTRTSLSGAMAISVTAMIGYLFLSVVLTREPGTGNVGALFADAIRNSGAQILTSTIPVLPTPQTVALPIVVVWIAGLIGIELTLRTRAILAGFAAPVMVYVIGLVLVGPNAAPSLLLAAAFVAVAALGLALSGDSTINQVLSQLADRSRRAFRIRRAAVGGLALIVLLITTMLIGPPLVGLSDAKPAEPRTRIPPPEQQLPESNPLGRLSGWARNPSQPLFAVRTNQPSRIRWVTLTEYNGLTWLPGSEYRSAGSVLPAQADLSPNTSVEQRYTMLGLDGLWLPAVEQPREVNDVRVSYDPTTGSLVHAQGLRTGLQYSVVSRRSDPNVSKLSNAALSDDPAIRRYANVPPNLPDGIVTLASNIVAPAVTPYNRALLIEQFLLRNFIFSPEGTSGHGLANLNFFLTVAQAQGGQRGTSEQFATAFALLARVAGLPTRVSVGFHAGTPQGNGRFMVTSGDAFAWPEVYFAGYGWLPFDPSPKPANNTSTPPDQATLQAQQQNRAKQSQLHELENPEPTHSPKGSKSGTKGPAPAERAREAGVFVLAGLAVLLLVATLGVVLRRRSLGRRRLSAASPPDRVVGAWAQVCDALRLARRKPPTHFTAHEVAMLATMATPRHPEPLPQLDELATAVNAVSFAPGIISGSYADFVVASARKYVETLRRRQAWWRRVLWPLRPGPLLWARTRTPAANAPAVAAELSPLTAAGNAQLVWAPPRSEVARIGRS
ncbi:MAG: DUF3488 and transglutaminase-like domain-containing protein [Mycobacteriales bacterium]